MAGSYPDMPSRRMAYHADGTVVWWATIATGDATGNWPAIKLTSIVEPANSAVQNLNDESTSNFAEWGNNAASVGTRFFAFLFPEPRDLYGAHLFMDSNESDGSSWGGWQTSTNSTNGITGDWDSVRIGGITGGFNSNLGWSNIGTGVGAESAWRTYIHPFDDDHSNVRTFRWSVHVGGSLTGNTTRLQTLHLFGVVNASWTGVRILFIDEDTGLEFTGPLDWGDVPRGVTLDHDIRLKNNSTLFTAHNVALSFGALTGTSDTWYTIKQAGGGFSTTTTVSSIAPSSTTGVITVRLSVATNQVPGQNAASFLKASVGSWDISAGVSGSASITGALTLA